MKKPQKYSLFIVSQFRSCSSLSLADSAAAAEGVTLIRGCPFSLLILFHLHRGSRTSAVPSPQPAQFRLAWLQWPSIFTFLLWAVNCSSSGVNKHVPGPPPSAPTAAEGSGGHLGEETPGIVWDESPECMWKAHGVSSRDPKCLFCSIPATLHWHFSALGHSLYPHGVLWSLDVIRISTELAEKTFTSKIQKGDG